MNDGNGAALQEQAERAVALKLHREAQDLREAVGRGLYELAFRLYVIHRYGLWRAVDPDLRSWEEYVEVYRFGDWARGKQFALLGQVRDMIIPALPSGEAPPDDPVSLSNWLDRPEIGKVMEKVAKPGWSKVEIVRPAVRRGLISLDEALSDAEALGRKDLSRKYLPLLEAKRPVVRTCYDCVNLHRGDPARGDSLVVLTGRGQKIPVVGMDFRFCPKRGKAWVGREGHCLTPREAEEGAKDCPTFENGELLSTGGVAGNRRAA